MRVGSLLLVGLLSAFPSFAAEEKKLDAPADRKTVGAADLMVTLDVKDLEVRRILKSMQTQCAIKNLIVDPNVQGNGTFYFRDVPCRTAFPIVLRTLSLESEVYSNSLVNVRTPR